MTPYWAYPYRIDGSGHTATTDVDDHINDLIYQVLFTSPGERVNRPDFGCGLNQLVFMPNGTVLASATQYLVQGSLTRWLSGIIAVQAVVVTTAESSLTVRVSYSKLNSGVSTTVQFTQPAP